MAGHDTTTSSSVDIADKSCGVMFVELFVENFHVNQCIPSLRNRASNYQLPEGTNEKLEK